MFHHFVFTGEKCEDFYTDLALADLPLQQPSQQCLELSWPVIYHHQYNFNSIRQCCQALSHSSFWASRNETNDKTSLPSPPSPPPVLKINNILNTNLLRSQSVEVKSAKI